MTISRRETLRFSATALASAQHRDFAAQRRRLGSRIHAPGGGRYHRGPVENQGQANADWRIRLPKNAGQGRRTRHSEAQWNAGIFGPRKAAAVLLRCAAAMRRPDAARHREVDWRATSQISPRW